MGPSHSLKFFTSCPIVGRSHRVSPSETSCSRVRNLWVTSPASRPAPVSAEADLLLFLSPQVLPGPCWGAGFPWDHNLLWASTQFDTESSTGCRGVSAPLGAAGTQLPHRGPHRIICPSMEHFLPSFSTDLGICRGLSVTYSHFYVRCSAATSFFLKYIITSLLLMDSLFCWLHCKERMLNDRKSCINWYEVDTEFFSFQKKTSVIL